VFFLNAGADITVLKRHGGWRSNTVAEGYMEDSVQNKLELSSKILGKEHQYNPIRYCGSTMFVQKM
jgi:hypothetical protein